MNPIIFIFILGMGLFISLLHSLLKSYAAVAVVFMAGLITYNRFDDLGAMALAMAVAAVCCGLGAAIVNNPNPKGIVHIQKGKEHGR